jgi:hypothetical protein
MYLFCCESKESSDCFHLSCSEVCSFNIISLSWLTVGLWDGGSYFEKYGALTDAYMPKDLASKAHRGIGFVTYEHPGTV